MAPGAWQEKTVMSSTETDDSGMYKMMGIVMGILTLFTLSVMLMANLLGGHEEDPTDQLMRNALVERISPVGVVRTAAMAEAEGEAQPAAVVAQLGPEELYTGACAACHTSGVAGAPKLGDTAAWADRNALGLEALVASVINGKGAMPARGGSSYSDEDIERAVKHLTGL